MRYTDVIGLEHIKKHLQSTVTHDRIAHAQLFVGPTGSGVLPMALAYARDILCKDSDQHSHAQLDRMSHPDLHFVYPTATTDLVKSKPVSDDFISHWIQFIQQHPYGSLANWHQAIAIEKKQSQIGVDEAKSVLSKISLKSYEGGYKILIIWAADKLNIAASNKLLKIIEEPPAKTVILLITDNEDRILDTIKSRCQLLHFPKLSQAAIATELQQAYHIEHTKAHQIARQSNGDFNKAIQYIDQSTEDLEFEQLFVQWVRTAFAARGNKSSINSLLNWSDQLASSPRERQKRFLLYCQEYFRQAMLLNYQAHQAVYLIPQLEGFQLDKFAPFIDGDRMYAINQTIEDAIYHIERNANPKIILTDIAIQLTRLLHQ